MQHCNTFNYIKIAILLYILGHMCTSFPHILYFFLEDDTVSFSNTYLQDWFGIHQLKNQTKDACYCCVFSSYQKYNCANIRIYKIEFRPLQGCANNDWFWTLRSAWWMFDSDGFINTTCARKKTHFLTVNARIVLCTGHSYCFIFC